jgi:hypothetical protein
MRKPPAKKPLSSTARATTLFRPEPLQLATALVSQNDGECFTPVERVHRPHPQLLQTPHKEYPAGE